MSVAFPAALTRTFEAGITGWTARASATLTHETTEVMWGSGAIKVVTPGAATFEGFWGDSSNTALNISVSSSTQYTMSVYVNAPAGATIRIQYNERDAGGTSLGTVTLVQYTAAGGWERKQGTFTTQATTATLRALTVFTYSTAQAITFYADGWQIDQAATAQTYDGSDSFVADNTLKPGLPGEFDPVIVQKAWF